jgi:hypothetical protein
MAPTPIERQLPKRRVTCARCDAAFDCGSGGQAGDQAGGCWCAAEDYRMPMPMAAGEDCLCPACLRAAASSTRIGSPA